jgi:uncharacterized protein with HEPN domain
MQSPDVQRIQHIKRYCEDIANFVERFGGYQQFITDRAYHNATCMCILQIGELANGLSPEFREKTKESMQWGLIRGMRNWVAHLYHKMDNEIIWETITSSIPQMNDFCDAILEQVQVQSDSPTQTMC